jgi:protein TonB
MVDEFTQQKHYTESGKDTLFAVPFIRPAAFPGGTTALMKFVSTNLAYPKGAAKKDIDGRVVVRFSVEKDGSLSNIEITRGASPELDAEAIRIVKSMPKWKPAAVYGELRVEKYTLPVLFRLRR